MSVKIIGDYKEVLPFAQVCPRITNFSLELYDLIMVFFWGGGDLTVEETINKYLWDKIVERSCMSSIHIAYVQEVIDVGQHGTALVNQSCMSGIHSVRSE